MPRKTLGMCRSPDYIKVGKTRKKRCEVVATAMPMGASRLFAFCFFLIQPVIFAGAQPNLLENFCINSSNFTTNSTYKSNLDQLLTTLSADTEINNGFYNSSLGKNADKVNAIALCRGDKKPDTCRSCINNSSQVLRELCPNQKEAIIWYDDCMFRYSNRYIFGSMEFGPYFFMYNVKNVSGPNEFNQAVASLLGNLTNKAASSDDSSMKFSTGNVTTGNQQTIYALVQCTPDLSKQECVNCLNNATSLLGECCSGREGGRVVAPSCNFRYEKDIFYENEAQLQTPSPATQPVSPPTPPAAPVSPPPTPNSGLPKSGKSSMYAGKAVEVAPTVIAGVISLLHLFG